MSAATDYFAMNRLGTDSLVNDSAWNNYWNFSQQYNAQQYAQSYAQQLAASQAAAQSSIPTATSVAGASGVNFGQSVSTTPVAPAESGGVGAGTVAVAVGATAIAATTLFLTKGKAGKNLLSKAKNLFNKKQTSEYALITVGNSKKPNIISLGSKNYHGFNIKNSTYPDKIVSNAEALGLEVNKGLKLADEATKIKSTQFMIKTNSGNPKYYGVRNGNGNYYFKEAKTGNKISIDDIGEGDRKALEKTMKEIDEAIANKNLNVDKVEFYNTVYGADINGGSAIYIANGGNSVMAKGKNSFVANSNKDGLRSVVTDRWKLNDERVITMRGKDSKLNEALAHAEKGNYADWTTIEGIWKPSASSKKWWHSLGINNGKPKGAITEKYWDDSTELIIKNGEIVGAKNSTRKLSYDEFAALRADFPQIFDDFMSHQKDFTGNLVRILS